MVPFAKLRGTQLPVTNIFITIFVIIKSIYCSVINMFEKKIKIFEKRVSVKKDKR